jgi:superfamily II DNA or RNA helicase
MKKAIIYTYATLDSRNSGWYKVGLTTKNADERIKEQDGTSNYQKQEKLLEFDFTTYINDEVSVEKIEKMFHNYLRYKLRCEVRKDKNREWFVTNGLGPIYEARDYVVAKLKIKTSPIILKSPKGKYQWQWDLVLKPFLNHFKQGFKKANSIIFCGGGKTIISYWATRLIRPLIKNKINLSVVVVPSLYLIKQTLDEYIQQQHIRKEDFNYLCVCSDKKITGSTEADLSIDEIPLATTDENIIRRFASKEYNNKGIRVIFTTYQSGKKLSKALKGITVDFTIYDEAHKAVGDSDKAFAHLVLDKNFKSQYKWFITATPKEWTGSLAS